MMLVSCKSNYKKNILGLGADCIAWSNQGPLIHHFFHLKCMIRATSHNREIVKKSIVNVKRSHNGVIIITLSSKIGYNLEHIADEIKRNSSDIWLRNADIMVTHGGRKWDVNCVTFTYQQHPARLILAWTSWCGLQLLSQLSVSHTRMKLRFFSSHPLVQSYRWYPCPNYSKVIANNKLNMQAIHLRRLSKTQKRRKMKMNENFHLRGEIMSRKRN